MISRREVLLGASAIAAGALLRRADFAWPAASQPGTPVNFAVPANACDCHTHIFGDPAKFPFVATRTYTPETASVEEQRALHRVLHTERVVIVQPSVYGTDNSCMLDALKQLGPGSRGIAVIDDKTTDGQLDEMDRAGVRGIRINLETGGLTDPKIGQQRLTAAIARIKNRSNWHIQIFTRPSVIEGIKDEVMASPVPIVFDHFGGAQAAAGVDQPGFATLVNLVKSGKAYVKISAPYLASEKGPGYEDVKPLAQALVAANLQRILWGTDWPHPDTRQVAGRKNTDIAPLRKVDDGANFNLLPTWVADEAQRKTILVENPGKLYGW